MATPEYWAEPRGDWTAIHCRIGEAHTVGVLDGKANEVYNLPPEVLDAIKDRLYAICMEQLEELERR